MSDNSGDEVNGGGRLTQSDRMVTQSFVGALREMLAQEKSDSIAISSSNELLTVVANLLEGLALDDLGLVDSALRELGLKSKTNLFSEVGKLTRRLHTSLVDFKHQLGPRLENLAGKGVQQATDQLESVMRMTDEAAHKVLALTDRQQEELQAQKTSAELILNSLDPDIPENLPLLNAAQDILQRNKALQGYNTDILMAQEYQDLSGQILRKVIHLVTEVEESLVTLIVMFGLPSDNLLGGKADIGGESAVEAAPAETSSACNQDDIDGLLDSLGF
ncbi:MAG: protein phosphatase CheZ [bacterium]|nr:protein phosphatase CheZ [bacterium]